MHQQHHTRASWYSCEHASKTDTEDMDYLWCNLGNAPHAESWHMEDLRALRFNKNIFIRVPKMNSGLTGLEQH